MKEHDTPLRIRLDNVFEQTPAGFSSSVNHTLQSLKTVSPTRKSTRWLAVTVVCAVLLCGSALAAKSLGVLDFLTYLITTPQDKVVIEDKIGKPLNQFSNGEKVIVQARDYLWNEMTFSMAMHVSPTDPNKYRLISRGDFGVDGIHTDEIWWGDEITTMDKWLPKGKEALVINVAQMNIGGKEMFCSLGWLPEERGETFLLEANLSFMTQERYAKLLDEHGNITLSVPVESWIYGSEERELATLQMTIEAPTADEWRKMYDGE